MLGVQFGGFVGRSVCLGFYEAVMIIFPGKSIGSGFSLSGETFRSPYQIGVRPGPADCFADKTQYF